MSASKQKARPPETARAKGRYSRVSRRIWNSPSFQQLTHPPPCGGWLWFRLLTGPELTNVPGLFQAWESGLAEALRWSLEGFRVAFAEALAEGLAKADWEVGLVWLPKAIEHNPPESLNVVLAWRTAWEELPECAIKLEAFSALEEWCKAKGEAWAEAFGKACRKPTGKASGKPRAIQNQDQKQDQRSDQISTAAASQRLVRSEPVSGTQRAATAVEESDGEDPEQERPIADRARAVLENPHDGRYSRPSRWPEVVAIARAWGSPWGMSEPKLRDDVSRDSDLRAILEALADGYAPEQLEPLGARAASDEYFKGLRSPGPAAFTATVIRRLLAERNSTEQAPATSAKAEERAARLKARDEQRQRDLLAEFEANGGSAALPRSIRAVVAKVGNVDG